MEIIPKYLLKLYKNQNSILYYVKVFPSIAIIQFMIHSNEISNNKINEENYRYVKCNYAHYKNISSYEISKYFFGM